MDHMSHCFVGITFVRLDEESDGSEAEGGKAASSLSFVWWFLSTLPGFCCFLTSASTWLPVATGSLFLE